MSLKRSMDELGEFWRGVAWIPRVCFALLFLAAIANIASLLGAFVSWQGAIADGIAFYRSWVTLPVAQALDRFGLTLSLDAVDSLVLWALLGLWLLRGLWERTNFKELHDFRYFGWFVLIAAGQFLIWSYMPNTDTAFGRPLARVVGPILLFLVAAPILLPIRHRATYFGPAAVALMTIFLLIAINTGLGR